MKRYVADYVDEDDGDMFLGGNAVENTTGKGSASSQVAETTIPNFLLKLWKLVDDERFSQCIQWDVTGFSFHVREPYGFSKDVLPLYFKHSNLNSFIRQLNMYGFRKVTNLEKGALKQQLDQDSLEFQHPYFVRGHPELLQYIKRKISNPRLGGTELDLHQSSGTTGTTSTSTGSKGVGHVLDEVRQLREKQIGMDAKLMQIKKENEALWREVAHMRQLHMKQQQVVNKLIQFLLSLVQPSGGKRLGKRQLLAIGPGLLEDAESVAQSGAKRPRSGSNTLKNNVVNIIESLEQELHSGTERPNSGGNNFSASRQRTGGPIIADVTDEPEHQNHMSTAEPPLSNVQSDKQQQRLNGVPTIVTAPPSNASTAGNNNQGSIAGASDALDFQDFSPGTLDGFGSDSFLDVEQFQNPTATHVLGNTEEPTPSPARLSTNPPLLQRSVSETYNNSIPYNAGTDEHTVQFTDGNDNPKWSKPEFSDYLDFVQTDLDSLKDYLSSGSFSVDQDSLSHLFTMADESNLLNVPYSTNQPDVVGNEVQLYKPPETTKNTVGSVSASTSPAPIISYTPSMNTVTPSPQSMMDSPAASAYAPMSIDASMTPIYASSSLPDEQQQRQMNHSVGLNAFSKPQQTLSFVPDTLNDDSMSLGTTDGMSASVLSTPMSSPAPNYSSQPPLMVSQSLRTQQVGETQQLLSPSDLRRQQTQQQVRSSAVTSNKPPTKLTADDLLRAALVRGKQNSRH